MTIEWLPWALEDLLRHDCSRARRKPPLRPIGAELRRAVEGFLVRFSSATVLPGQQVRRMPGVPPDICVTIGKTGGPYRVFFRYDSPRDVMEIWRVAYPRGARLRP